MARFTDVLTFAQGESEEFKRTVTELLWTIHYWPLGEELLGEIAERASRFLAPKLRFVGVYQAFNYDHYTQDFKIDPRYCLEKENQIDPTQEYVIQCNKTHVYLFHELVHFYHVLGSSYTGDFYEEIRTTGLYHHADERYSENAFRQQVHLDRRPCYAWKPVTRHGRVSKYYPLEKQLRATLGLPDQEPLTRKSPECAFSFVLPKAKRALQGSP